MKRFTFFLSVILCIFLLAACSNASADVTKAAGDTDSSENQETASDSACIIKEQGRYRLKIEENTETDGDTVILTRIYTVDDLKVTAYRISGEGEYTVSFPIEAASELGIYDDSISDWTWAPAAEADIREKTIAVEGEKACIIATSPLSFNLLENDSLEYFPEKDGYFSIENNTLYITADLSESDYTDFFVFTSPDHKLDRELENGAKVLEKEYRNADFLWMYSGYYGRAHDSYEPSGENVYYSCVASYNIEAFSSRIKCAECIPLTFASIDIESRKQNEAGYFPTSSKSTWLATDYGIEAGFYDTRFNTDLLENYRMCILRLDGDYYPEISGKYFDYYISFAENNHFDSENGGWFVADYGHSCEHSLPHCSLNHQAAELLLLYNYADLYERQDLRDLGDRMLTAIEDAAEGFIKSDNNLEYAIFPDGHYGLTDYPYLTYNDLWNLQNYLYKTRGEINPSIKKMMDCKKKWMDNHGISAYSKGAEWE